MNFLERLNQKGDKIYYYYDLGREKGQRPSTGIFTYVKPKTAEQRMHNAETFKLLEVKKSQAILEKQAIGTPFIPKHKFKENFLDYYADYVKKNKKDNNKHLYYSLYHFKNFIKVEYISPKEITEELCKDYRQYLLERLNGECPANYFRPFRRMIKAATKAGYFVDNPVEDVKGKEKKNKRVKANLEAEDYLKLLRTPLFNEDIREAFIISCYQGFRFCDVSPFAWETISLEKGFGELTQNKTGIPLSITLHPVSIEILSRRYQRLPPEKRKGPIFRLPSLRACNYALEVWCKNAGIESHITWHCARLSFSILLQDKNVEAVTVALLMGHTTPKYVLANYKRIRPKDAKKSINLLPCPDDISHNI
ncbi:site-specific integrase [Chitinophaga vietnamensis]|uniref:site-specific integrase n=1 Tax=Chitinophaga vietnamensis TaxID=2593957 RepID=UPI001177902B|nr:site-specific integrase [Chitinophaga vietnamensis]